MNKIILSIVIGMSILKTEAQTLVFNASDSLMQQGNYQKALVILDSVEVGTAELFYRKGAIYQTTGNYSKAIENYIKSLEIQNNPLVTKKLGKVYELAGLNSKAIRTYEKIMEIDATNLLVANRLGKLYLANFKSEKAERIFKFLTVKDSLNPNYFYLLARSQLKQKKFLKMGQSYLDAYTIDTLHIKSCLLYTSPSPRD